MPTPWADRVKQRGQLSIYIGPSVTGTWAKILKKALSEFNKLSQSHRLGVVLKKSRFASAARGSGGADVSVAIANGRISWTYEGLTQTSEINGERMHGYTLQYEKNNRIEKAFVFLPKTPKVRTPQGDRTVGDNVKKVIAVHEFVHACGLSDKEHTMKGGLFRGSPSVDIGNTAAGDRVRVYPNVKKYTYMPPLVLDADTVKHIRRIWRRSASTGTKRGSLDRESTRQYAANRVGPVMGGTARCNGEVRGATRHRSPLV